MKLATKVMDADKNIVMLSVSGRIKSGYLADLQNEFSRLAKGPAVKLILDLQEVVGIDSTGIGELIKARADIIAGGGTMILMGSTPPVEMLMKLSGLDQYFQIVSTYDQAIQLINP